MTAVCGCCQDVGWTDPATFFLCSVDHHETFNFAGTVMLACPHCNDDTPVEPLRQPCESVEQASRLLAPLADMVLSRHVDELGIHVSELRQQRAIEHLEQVFGLPAGFYIDSENSASDEAQSPPVEDPALVDAENSESEAVAA